MGEIILCSHRRDGHNDAAFHVVAGTLPPLLRALVARAGKCFV